MTRDGESGKPEKQSGTHWGGGGGWSLFYETQLLYFRQLKGTQALPFLQEDEFICIGDVKIFYVVITLLFWMQHSRASISVTDFHPSTLCAVTELPQDHNTRQITNQTVRPLCMQTLLLEMCLWKFSSECSLYGNNILVHRENGNGLMGQWWRCLEMRTVKYWLIICILFWMPNIPAFHSPSG